MFNINVRYILGPVIELYPSVMCVRRTLRVLLYNNI